MHIHIVTYMYMYMYMYMFMYMFMYMYVIFAPSVVGRLVLEELAGPWIAGSTLGEVRCSSSVDTYIMSL